MNWQIILTYDILSFSNILEFENIIIIQPKSFFQSTVFTFYSNKQQIHVYIVCIDSICNNVGPGRATTAAFRCSSQNQILLHCTTEQYN